MSTRTSPINSTIYPSLELTDSDSCATPALTSTLILPYVQLDIKYFDLGLEYRDAVR